MRNIAIKVEDNAKELAEVLNWYIKDTDLQPLIGNARCGYWYIIKYEPSSYKIVEYLCGSPFATIDNFFENTPQFMTLPLDIQKEAIIRSESKSPIPFIIDIYAGSDDGGFC